MNPPSKAALPQSQEAPPDLHGKVLDLDLLLALITVNDTQSFTIAAVKLDCTQAAVSQQIQRLESMVGFQLLIRSQRSVQLTDEGELLVEHGRRMLALNEEALASLRPQTMFGMVRIGAMDNYAIRILPPLLARFSKEHPAVRVEILTGLTYVLGGMLGKEIDLLIAPELQPSGHVLRTEHTVWVGADPELRKRDLIPMALLPQGSLFRDIALSALQAGNLNWHPAYVCSSMATMTAIVASGLAIGICPESLVGGPLKQLPKGKPFGALPDVYITLRDAGNKMSRAAKVLHKFLVENTGRGKPGK